MEENELHINRALFIRLSQGEEDAFRQVIRFYHQQLLPITVRLVKSEPEARDIMQEVFLKLWLNRTELVRVENPGGWLHTVMANTTSKHIRSRLRYELRVKHLIESAAEPVDNVLDQLDARFAQSLIDDAVSRLPERRKRVFLLSRREGLSRKEIAARLNISENTVRNQLAEAAQFIHEHLKRNGPLCIPAFLFLLSEMY